MTIKTNANFTFQKENKFNIKHKNVRQVPKRLVSLDGRPKFLILSPEYWKELPLSFEHLRKELVYSSGASPDKAPKARTTFRKRGKSRVGKFLSCFYCSMKNEIYVNTDGIATTETF